MKKSIITLFAIAISLTSFSQSKILKDSAEAHALSEECVKLFYQNKITAAFASIKPYWPIPESEIDNMEMKTLVKLNMVSERFGEPIGYAKVDHEKIADIAIRETYLVQYERHAIRVMLVYYHSSNGYILNSFSWDDSYMDEFKRVPFE